MILLNGVYLQATLLTSQIKIAAYQSFIDLSRKQVESGKL